MSGPTAVFLTHHCFGSNECKYKPSSAQSLRRHLTAQHHYMFPLHIDKVRQHNNATYLYVNEPSSSSKEVIIDQHYACPCCIDHFASLADLKGHFKVAHHTYLPEQIQEQESQRPQESATPSYSRSSTRPPSITSNASSSSNSISSKRQHNEV
ncbi:hypothetical protein BDB00DRAFT_735703, partial [Zychaea mexicana]|uniref:uncharacterized protein n=1 Tax=Zychaea mexicana TaxID=64656 RepID=UPI0022FE4B8C